MVDCAGSSKLMYLSILIRLTLPIDGAGAQWQGAAGGDSVPAAAQAGDEGRWLGLASAASTAVSHFSRSCPASSVIMRANARTCAWRRPCSGSRKGWRRADLAQCLVSKAQLVIGARSSDLRRLTGATQTAVTLPLASRLDETYVVPGPALHITLLGLGSQFLGPGCTGSNAPSYRISPRDCPVLQSGFVIFPVSRVGHVGAAWSCDW